MRPFRRPHSRRATALLALGSVALAACGGGGEVRSDAVSPPITAAGDSAASDGDAATVFTQVFSSATPLDGEAFDGATLAGADAVIWFWAPWCTICRAEAPEVAEVAERYAGRLAFVGVPGRGELDAMRDFVADTGTTSLTHMAGLDGSVWSAFGVYGQPAFAFIDDTGEVEVFIGGMGGEALADRVDELLAT